MANATSLADALAGAPAVDDALRRWSEAQLQVAAQVMPFAEYAERSQVFEMPDLATMPTAATNDWLSFAYCGFVLTLPACNRQTAEAKSVTASFRQTGCWCRTLHLALYPDGHAAAGTPGPASGAPFRLPAEDWRDGRGD